MGRLGMSSKNTYRKIHTDTDQSGTQSIDPRALATPCSPSSPSQHTHFSETLPAKFGQLAQVWAVWGSPYRLLGATTPKAAILRSLPPSAHITQLHSVYVEGVIGCLVLERCDLDLLPLLERMPTLVEETLRLGASRVGLGTPLETALIWWRRPLGGSWWGRVGGSFRSAPQCRPARAG